MGCIKRASLGCLGLTVALFALWFGYLRYHAYLLTLRHTCPFEALVVDRSVFPPETQAGQLMEDPGPAINTASDNLGRAFYLSHGIASHWVYQLVTAHDAAQVFAEQRRWQFYLRPTGNPNLGPPVGPWETPVELSYRSPIADQYYVACGPHAWIYMCKVIAQYEEYYVYLHAHMGGAMMYADFERVMRAADAKMAACLGKPLP